MDILNDTLNIISHSVQPTAEWLGEANDRYPFFMLPAMLHLECHGIDSDPDLLARLAIAWPDRKSLAMRLGVNASVFASFYPAQASEATPDTDSTIDRFLDNYGHTSDKEIEALNKAIFNPTPDYADILAAQERTHRQQAGADDGLGADDRMINDFIEQSRQKKREAVAAVPTSQHVDPAAAAAVAHLPIAEPSSPDESMLSESLAKMYISRGKYSKALEIIENINLKFPEKSIYFADQIRFLRKLVLNEKLTKQKQQ